MFYVQSEVLVICSLQHMGLCRCCSSSSGYGKISRMTLETLAAFSGGVNGVVATGLRGRQTNLFPAKTKPESPKSKTSKNKAP